jgi:hypothetical protein
MGKRIYGAISIGLEMRCGVKVEGEMGKRIYGVEYLPD